MNRLNVPPGYKIDKKQISATAMFAVNNIPGVDRHTLQKLLEMMNTSGSFGSITVEQFERLLDLTEEYIVDGREDCSLEVLIKLLSIHTPPAQNDNDGYYLTLSDNPQGGNGGDGNSGSIIFKQKGDDHER